MSEVPLTVPIEDAADLEGTRQVRLPEALAERLGAGPYVLLVRGDRRVAAQVARSPSPDERCQVDKHLRLLLRCGNEDEVSLESVALPAAERIRLEGPQTWADDQHRQMLAQALRGGPVNLGQTLPLFLVSGTMVEFRVLGLDPGPHCVWTHTTQVELVGRGGKADRGRAFTFADVGDLEEQKAKLRELVVLPLRRREVFEGLGIEPPRGVLLWGPPGTGKSLLARALVEEVGLPYFLIRGPEVFTSLVGASEDRIREAFDAAQKAAPSLLLVEELDTLAATGQSSTGDLQRRLIATLATMFDSLAGVQTIVIATCRRPEDLDRSLRMPGRLDHEVYVGVPGRQARRQILDVCTRRMSLAPDVDLDEVAELTHGYVGADLAMLAREAGLTALRRCLGGELDDDAAVRAVDSATAITMEDVRAALAVTFPSALREVRVELPERVSWDDIGGLGKVKTLLREDLVETLLHPETCRRLGQAPPRGVLLYGPPGTGKTLLAKAVASESAANFIAVRGPELRSKWFGESEEKVRYIFARAREVLPCVIFFDEIDALAPQRGRPGSEHSESIVNQLLAEMDGLGTGDGVLVIGATNRPELLDEALVRPGRFDYFIYVPLPDHESRLAILRVHTRRMAPYMTDDARAYVDELAEYTEGYSGADLANLCRLTAMATLRGMRGTDQELVVTRQHLEDAFTEVRATRDRLQQSRSGPLPGDQPPWEH